MIIWAVFEIGDHDDGGDVLRGIFSSEQKARYFMATTKPDNFFYGWSLEQWQIDAPNSGTLIERE